MNFLPWLAGGAALGLAARGRRETFLWRYREIPRYVADRPLGRPNRATTGHLEVEEFEGRKGVKRHLTRWEEGTIPTKIALAISPPKGYHGRRKWHVRDGERRFGSYSEERWNVFLNEIRRNGIKTPLWVQVDPGDEAQIMEGSHRVQAAAQLGLHTVPVVIKYYGLREDEKAGIVAPKVPRTVVRDDPTRRR